MGDAGAAALQPQRPAHGQAQAIFKEQAPWVTIGHSVVHQPVRKEVVDFRISPFGVNVFYGVDLQGK